MLRKILLVISASLFFAVGIYAQGTSTTATPAATTTTASTTTKTGTAPRFTPTKDQIMQGQKLLKEKKQYDGDATGVYNDPTRAAIKVFQKDNGLDQNGKFDKLTLEKMNIALTDKQKGLPSTAASSSSTTKTPKTGTTSSSTATNSSDSPKRPAPFTANKDQITALQKVLKDGKMYAGEANGERGDALKDAVKKYQEASGLKVTGGINATVLEKAGIALTDKQKDQVAAQAAYDAAKAPKN